ncbi:hypothetical protein HYH02_010189 [Chlamydomonas schloesseri]|uniref:Uncharacterized protein n=1 Tax=Chlamydomonas schloesseri TaxID=2026947 RepID=A0A835TKP2_9CHLO|nr:hypothetical protein HYH02_010189 [Chlamydomonas schloesseri]|eukprot:KAG2440610.1 hypothetical protein HYH02_010189 [Chlamydomonas schloesseri]
MASSLCSLSSRCCGVLSSVSAQRPGVVPLTSTRRSQQRLACAPLCAVSGAGDWHTNTQPQPALCSGDGSGNSHGNGGNRIGGNGGGNGSGNSGSSSGAGGFDDSCSRRNWGYMPRGAALLTHATLGALAITAITAAMPPQGKAAGSRSSAAAASSAQLSSSPAKDSHLLHPHHTLSETFSSHAYGEGSPMRPRSKVVHVPVRGSTLVVPLASSCAGSSGGEAAVVRRVGGAAAGGGGLGGLLHRSRTVEAPIELTDGEVSLMANRQYRVRECVFIH